MYFKSVNAALKCLADQLGCKIIVATREPTEEELTDGTDVFTVISSTFTIKMDVTRTDEKTDEELNVTPEELRTFLQYDENDYPNKADMRFLIKVAEKRITLDLDSSNENILFIGI